MAPASDFEITGLAAIEEAPDLQTGYSWLSEEFSATTWDEPEAARQILVNYGETLRQKFKANNKASTNFLEEMAPIKLEEIPIESIEDSQAARTQQVDKWLEANNSYLEETNDPQLIARKGLFDKFLPQQALLKKREINDPNFFQDAGARLLLGAGRPLETLFDVDTSYLTQFTNPERDDDFTSDLITGLGQVGAAAGITAATGGIGGLAYLGATATGEVKNTYEDIKEETGDTTKAATAAAITGGAQAVSMAIGGSSILRIGGRLGNLIKGSAEKAVSSVAEGATESAVKTVFKRAFIEGVAQGTGESIETVGTNYAYRNGLDDPSRGILQGVGRSFAVGAVLGSGADIAISGAEAMRETAPAVSLVEVGPTEQIETPIEAAPIIDVQETLDARIAESLPTQDKYGQANFKPEQKTYDLEPSTFSESYLDADISFKTDNNFNYYLQEDGSSVRIGEDETIKGGADKTFFLSEDIATVLSLYKMRGLTDPSGATPTITTDGSKLYIKSDYIGSDLDILEKPTGPGIVEVPILEGPEVGAVPIEVNAPRHDGEAIIYSSNIGRPITEVNIKPVKEESQPRTLALRIMENENLDPSVREAFTRKLPDGTIDTTLRYIPQSREATQLEADKFVQDVGGIPEAINDILTGANVREAPVMASGMKLLKVVSDNIASARAAGDLISVSKSQKIANQLVSKITKMGTGLGQAVDILRLFQQSPQFKLDMTMNSLENSIRQKVLKSEGISEEAANLEVEQLEQLNEQIAKLPAESEEVVKLQKQQEKLRTRIENRTARIEEKIGKDFPVEQREEYKRWLEAYQKMPEGSKAEKISKRRIDAIEGKLAALQKGNLDWLYNYRVKNMLFELGTQMVNVFGNTGISITRSAGMIAGAPLRGENPVTAAKNMLGGVAKSFPRAARGAVNEFLNRGLTRYEDVTGTDIESAPKLVQPILKVVMPVLDTNMRILAAMDSFFGIPLEEGISQVLLSESPEFKRMTKARQVKAIRELTQGDADTVRRAEADSDAIISILEEAGEKITPRQKRELFEDALVRQRPEDLRERARAWSDKALLRNTPEGIGGFIASQLNNAANYELYGAKPLRLMIMFTRATGNIINQKLDHSPLGLATAFNADNALERSTILGTAIGSSIAAGLMLGLADEDIDNPNPTFTIHGSGPKDMSHMLQKRQSGWEPYTFQFGDTYIKYSESPIATMFAAMGGYLDSKRYNKHKVDEETAVSYIMASSFKSLFEQPITKYAGEFVDILSGRSRDDVKSATAKLAQKIAIDVTKSSVPFIRTISSLNRMWEDPVDTRLDLASNILAGTPFAYDVGGRPSLNMFGEPILTGRTEIERASAVSRFMSSKITDPAIRFLSDHGYFVPDAWDHRRLVGKAYSDIIEDRMKTLDVSDVERLTEKERYEVQRLAGPEIKRTVMKYAKRYGNRKFDPRVQEDMNKEINAIYRETKLDILEDEKIPGTPLGWEE